MALDASSLTFVDMAIILMLAIGLVTGFIRGIIRQAFSLGGLIAGLIIGSFFSKMSPATIGLICVGAAAIIAVPTVILVRRKKKTAN